MKSKPSKGINSKWSNPRSETSNIYSRMKGVGRIWRLYGRRIRIQKEVENEGEEIEETSTIYYIQRVFILI